MSNDSDQMTTGIEGAVADVAAFHKACGVPSLDSPRFPALDRVLLRFTLIAEEFDELVDAVEKDNIVQTADAIGDLIYVLIGTALEFGIPLGPVWAEIQRSNMAKVDPATGKVRRRDDGKILKPEGWKAPDIAAAMVLRGDDERS